MTRARFLTASRLALTITIINAGMVLIGLFLSLNRAAPPFIGIQSLTTIVYSVFAFLIISRDARHTVGWLFLIVGFFSALQELTGGMSIAASSLPAEAQGLIFWAGSLAWIPALMIPISLVLQFFPDGRLPSGRWWPVTAAAVAGMTGTFASLAFHPWPWSEHELWFPQNPLGIAGSETFFEGLDDLSVILFGAGLLGSLAAVVSRFRRAQGIERAQMKWLVYAAVVGVSLLFIHDFLGDPLGLLPFVSLPILLASAIGLAILRYRLFDIDILIRRTLIYSALTGTLAVVYFGSIILLQRLLPAQTQLTTVLSTLAIAGLFSPLRSRIQREVDRRFFRRQYNAAQTLAAFTARTRNEVVLEQLNLTLVNVVQDSMQPDSVSLWLRDPGFEREHSR